ncbi:ribonuclease P protein component [Cardinium endosymbiont of Encarsia pergandiella]|uniref:ribonuclease P protein component n=1 Tax=Cardinium endosymbiont of Encarsia pergandiella TaxID=249402 RepID=UPI0009FFEC06|nr:ribonuclease P protein component [Cardinium endosymbiont of Encarsia pergandiella]
MGKNKFPKYNRLVNRSDIRMLFQQGSVLKLHPCSVFYLQKKKELFLYNKVLFAVSKRNIPSAVQRNRVKRLLREAYRIHKSILDDVLETTASKFVFLIGYVYTGKEENIHYPMFNRAVIKSLEHFRFLLNRTPPE